jgi:polysaccharide export outer membrane protein
MRTANVVLLVAVVGLLGLSWQAQRETHRRLDALAAAVAARPAEAVAPAAPLPEVVAGPAAPKRLPEPDYVIEAPDELAVEVGVRAPSTGVAHPLTEYGGTYLVRPDGTVNLGPLGAVAVAGLTQEQAAAAIRQAVTDRMPGYPRSGQTPVATVAIRSANSKRFYVVTDSPDGEQVAPFPCTGNETVMDALARSGALGTVAGKAVAVNRPVGPGCFQSLPVDWVGITQQGQTATNYQLLPGDRLYVKAGK